MPFLNGANKVLQSEGLKGIIFELNEIDPNFKTIILILKKSSFTEEKRFKVRNEPNLFNIFFLRK
ncbi:MAG: hypothetical protein IPG38_08550 [Chitinophagaceae bacterium]|nr:hypothetical protein [Chitinophagaceae bacterium]